MSEKCYVTIVLLIHPYSLVTLQSAIADTKVQLEEIIEACDRLIAGNTLSHLVCANISPEALLLMHRLDSNEKYRRSRKTFAQWAKTVKIWSIWQIIVRP